MPFIQLVSASFLLSLLVLCTCTFLVSSTRCRDAYTMCPVLCDIQIALYTKKTSLKTQHTQTHKRNKNTWTFGLTQRATYANVSRRIYYTYSFACALLCVYVLCRPCIELTYTHRHNRNVNNAHSGRIQATTTRITTTHTRSHVRARNTHTYTEVCMMSVCRNVFKEHPFIPLHIVHLYTSNSYTTYYIT